METEKEKSICEPSFLETIKRIDEVSELKWKYINEKIQDRDTKYQIQFTAAEKAIAIASTAQEKLVAQALDGTKEAINKADVATDKRFELLSEKINGLSDILNKNAGAQGIYVTHSDLGIVVEKIQTSFESALKPLVLQVNNITAAQNNQQGKSSGLNAGWAYLLGGISLISTLIAIFVALSK